MCSTGQPLSFAGLQERSSKKLDNIKIDECPEIWFKGNSIPGGRGEA